MKTNIEQVRDALEEIANHYETNDRDIANRALTLLDGKELSDL